MADPVADPLEALHSPIVATQPDPAYAADLRARIDAAFDLPEGVTVSNLAEPPPSVADRAGPRHGDIGYVSLWVPDIERAAAFFSTVLGWNYAPSHSPLGRQVAGVEPAHGLFGEQEPGTLFLCFVVDDVDDTLERVRDAGGVAGEPQDAPYGRVADCVDDQGMPFALVAGASGGGAPGFRAERGAAHGRHAGDVAYITIEVIDSVKARAFYGSVLGWRFGPGSVTDGWGVDDVVPMVGLVGTAGMAAEPSTTSAAGRGAGTGGRQQPGPNVVPMYRVDDIDAAVARVRAAGGRASDPERQPYGVTSACVDDQGTRFWLGQL